MHVLLTYILDSIFPPRADEQLVRALTEEQVTSRYAPENVRGVTALSAFRHPQIHALIHEAKYEHNKTAQKLLGALLIQHCKLHKNLACALWVPVPLSPARKRARGYNQVEAILSQTAMPFATDILSRTRDTKRQTELSKNERLSNVQGAFTCTHPELIYGKHIVLLDDVVTTGATIAAARNAISPHNPATITLIALAH